MNGYSDLKIRVEKASDGTYRVSASGPAGKAEGSFQLPFREFELENFVLRLARPQGSVRRMESPQRQLVTDFGGRLFDAFFTAGLRDLYRDSCTLTQGEDKGLRITLSLNEVPELMHIPWEYLYDDPNFLAISTWTPVVRYIDLPRGRRPLPVTLPLRILAMVSSPTDAPSLDVAHERANLEQALKKLVERQAVEITWLDTATLRALQDTLRGGTFHVFHYIGHGGYDTRADDGVLLLEGENEAGRPVSGADLGTILHDHASLRLAVLNACEGARTSSTDPFAGVATSLVQHEIPAVIAMQFEITDRAAIVFAAGFYSAIADGYPVDAALAEARKSIFADENDVEWGAPVLFMRVPDGRIFDLPKADALPRAPDGEPAKKGEEPAVEPARRLPGGRKRWLVGAGVGAAALAATLAAVLLLGGNDGTGVRPPVVAWTRLSPAALGGDGKQEVTAVAPTTNGDAVAVGFTSVAGVRIPQLWAFEPAGWSPKTTYESGGLYSGVAFNASGITVAAGRTSPVRNVHEPAQDALAVTLAERTGMNVCRDACSNDAAGMDRGGQAMWAVAARRGGGFAAVGYEFDPADGTFNAAAWWSKNGKEEWKRAPGTPELSAPRDQVMRAVAETSSGLLVAVGWDGRSPSAWTSPDGLRWTRHIVEPAQVNSPGTLHLNGVAESGGRLFAVGSAADAKGEHSQPRIYVSDDLTAEHWSRLAVDSEPAAMEDMLGATPFGESLLVVGFGHRDGRQAAKAWWILSEDTVVALDDRSFRGSGSYHMTAVTVPSPGVLLAVGAGPPTGSGDAEQDGAAWQGKLRTK